MNTKDFYVTIHGNIFNPYMRCFQTIDGKFLRRVDIDEGDYLREVLNVYLDTENVIEINEVPGVWNFLFELKDSDGYRALIFTKKNKRRVFKVLYLNPNVDVKHGYIRNGFTMIGYKINNANDKLLNKVLKESGNSISYNELVKLVETFSDDSLTDNLNTLNSLQL